MAGLALSPQPVHVAPIMTEIDDIPDMPALRARIDALDERLVAMLAQRRDLIARAAQIKARDDIPARIKWRVEEVVLNVRRHAAKDGLDPDLVEALWRQLIEVAIAQEDRHLQGEQPEQPR